MTTNPFFSIIIPCYNCGLTIRETVSSVTSQNFHSFEIILVNDCSTDDTSTVLTELATSTPNTKLIQNPTNLGPGGSRNAGLKNASGEYICFLDSDDAFAPYLLEKLHDHIVNSGSDLVFFDFKRCFPGGKEQNFNLTGIFDSSSSKNDFIAYSGESVCMLTVRKELLTQLEFPPTYLAEDVVMVPILCSLAVKPSAIHFIGYHYTFTPGSLSRTANQRMLDSLIESSRFMDKYTVGIPGYQAEFEFRKIRLICYNYVYVACRQHKPVNEIASDVSSLMSIFPDWDKNLYIDGLPLRKRIFISLVKKRMFRIVRLYVRLQEFYFASKRTSK